MAQRLKRVPAMRETWVWSLCQEDPLEKEVAPHSSDLAWSIPWTEEPGRLQFLRSQRVGHNWVSSLHFTSYQCQFIFISIMLTFWSVHLFLLNEKHAYLKLRRKLTCSYFYFFISCLWENIFKHVILSYLQQWRNHGIK